MSYTNEELEQIKRIELDILLEIDRVCKENNIEYFLIGGTALGAIRHSGFIPWDDDIDIGMTRENYNRFNNIISKKISNQYFVQTPYSDKYSPFLYTKVRKNNTEFVEWCNRNSKMHKGIYIDVFPYDNIPDDEILRKKQFKIIQILNRIYVFKQSSDMTKRPLTKGDYLKYICRKIINILLKFIPRIFIIKKIEKEITKYSNDNTEKKACLFFPKYMVEYMDSNTLNPLKNILFEQYTFPCPNDLDTYLTNHYGDYMKLPPVEDRVGHRPFKIKF